MKIKKNLIIIGTIFSFFLITGLVFADTNGVYHHAKDVLAGIFGNDEGDQNSIYQFNNEIIFNKSVEFNNNVSVRNISANKYEITGNLNILLG